MRVYSVKPDVEHYQWFQLEDRELSNSAVASPLPLDCTPRENGWISPKVTIPHPELKRGDFFDLDRTGQLILSPELRCRVAAERFFGDAGEILPLAYQGRQYLLLNVMQCINCLNLGKCQWSDEGYEGRRSLTRLVFHRDRFAYSSIFKVPELRTANLTIVRDGDPENDFKAAYEHHGLTGLTFELVWEG